ncbi:MAG: hypothetical protein GY856_36770 [bacterium]|nr:hypothetical protein [bacterium]
MTDLDDDLVPAILDLIDEFGVDTVFETVTQSYDSSTGKTTESGAVDNTRKASLPLEYEDKYVDGDFVRRGDCYTYIAASGLTWTPVKGMKVTFTNPSGGADDVFDAVKVKRLDTGTSTGAWRFQLRQ